MRTVQRTSRLAAVGGIPALAAALLLAWWSAPCGAGPAGIGAEEGLIAKKGRPRTVAELVKLYDSKHCGECHYDIYWEWEKSIHSRSVFGTGRTALTFLTTISGGLTQFPYSGAKKPADIRAGHLMGCAKCHLPQLADAEDDVAREIVSDLFKWQDAVKGKNAAEAARLEAKLKSLNIGCVVCHNRNAVTHKWTDGYPRRRAVYGSKEGPHFCGCFPEMKKSSVMGEAMLCGQCHGLGPNFELDNPTQCATAYGSYLFAYLADGGRETCQDCHMRKNKLGHNIQAYRDPAMARAALDFSVEIARILPDGGARGNPGPVPRFAVNVAMTNRAGHSIPDG